MDLAIDVTSNCRVRVLLVPVSPIKKSTFYKYVELVKAFNVVRLGDVTPDLKKGAGAMFSSQVFQEGQMHFQFLTHWTREHAELEDFQPHRRIFGVIGIIDCQEWKNRDLSEGYSQFAQDIEKVQKLYPTAIATRCFAFDPTETQEDDTKGLIMIPNVGNMSFYMSTMICDFASEILSQFAILAKRIERLSVLESPLPTTIQNLSPRSRPQPQQPQKQNRYSQPPLTVTSSTSSNLLKRASLQQTNLQNQVNSNTVTSLHRLSINSSTSTSHSSTGENIRTKKRTPGRIKKLLGDFYLLAGRLPDAVNHYDQAIEITKTTSDLLWLASAMEGWICATVLLEYLQADIGHIVSRSTRIADPYTLDHNSPDDDDTSHVTATQEPRSTLTVIAEQYTSIITNYSRVSMTASFPVPDIVYAEACLKIGRALTTAYLNAGWNETTMALIVQCRLKDDEEEEEEEKNSNSLFLATKDYARLKSSGIPRYDIAEWVTKIWEVHMDDLALLDQVYLTTAMSTIYSAIGYNRKAAWLMHESVGRMLPLLIQHRRSELSKDMARKALFTTVNHDSGVLVILRRICEVYGIGERNVHDGGALEAMKQEDQGFLSSASSSLLSAPGHAIRHKQLSLRFGWPELQIDILKQCISVSDALLDNGSRLYYTTVLLKNMYQYITKADQIRLATAIQGLVVSSANVKDKKATGRGTESINYWGVNIVSSIEAKKLISRKAVYAHPIKKEGLAHEEKERQENDVGVDSDPFIYNPFAKKVINEYKAILVKDEVSEFKVTLINPFGFDLELQNIILSTSGIAFNATPMAITIPANATIILPLTGTPEETGVLIVRGCLIQIIGFAEQEFLVNHETKKAPEDTFTDDFIKYKQSGLAAIKINRKRETSGDLSPFKFYQLSVIENQPLLKIKTTSLMHGAVMLYEGEVTYITMELENIGHTPVDFITLSFTDSTTANPLGMNPELPMEEQYEIELYTKGTRVFSWEGSTTDPSTGSDFSGKKVWLLPGTTTTIKINVYGKKDCRAGTIQVDYGYLDRTVAAVVKAQNEEQVKTDDNSSPTTACSIFYTRQLYLNVMITVYQNLEPFNWDVAYLRHSMPATKEALDMALQCIHEQSVQNNNDSTSGNAIVIHRQPIEDLLLVTRNVELESQEKNGFCLVTVDVRNTWTQPFDVEFVVDNSSVEQKDSLKSCVTIPSGSTSRIILPLKRLFLPADICTQDIPSLDPHKQFVVAQGPKLSEEQTHARLRMFWYREDLLGRIKANWFCRDTKRHGVLNLRSSLRLNALQLGILKKEDVEFLVDIQGASVKKLSHRRFVCECNDFVTLNISIRNNFPHPIKLILRLQPVQSYNDGVKEYDLSSKLLIEGTEQAILPEIPATSGVTSHSFPIFFLSRGQFELLYHAEDVHTRRIYYDHEWAIVDAVEA